ncbi:MAG: ATP-binding protein [Cyanobacteria bacterium P01_D01_bin.56]
MPFILAFLGFWVTGTTFLGLIFSAKFEDKFHRQAQELSTLVNREIDQELESLREKARLLSVKSDIVQATLAENELQLKQSLIPLSAILSNDKIAVINQAQEKLINIKSLPFKDVEFDIDDVHSLVVTGADISTIVSSKIDGPPMLTGTAPIKNNEKIIGGILLGSALGDEFLTQINQSIHYELVILSDENLVLASTFSDKTVFTANQLNNLDLVTVNDQKFFAYPIELKGLQDKKFTLVLLESQEQLEQIILAIWGIVATVSFIGASFTIAIAYWIAQRTARPIQDITQVARQVVQKERFDLRTGVSTQDEIGTLAQSLNQLIDWVGQYTHDLEMAAQTLELRVDERTKDLSNALKELKETQSQLIQTEKMSSLGQMIAGIAHEINNPISFIQGNITPLKEYFEDLLELIETYKREYPTPTAAVLETQEDIDLEFILDDLDKLFQSLSIGTKRVHEIVVSLRNFSRLDESVVKDVNIHDGLDSTLLILNHRIKNCVIVTKDYGDLPTTRCLPAQLNQVFTNIIANALDAMFDADCEPKELSIVTRAIATDQIEITIRDSGPGIPEHIRSKVFDPFFTTKPVGKGTGLGLGICFKIVQQHQGRIDIRTQTEQGTEFIITLPTNAIDKSSPTPSHES